jgi:hypothetical protein
MKPTRTLPGINNIYLGGGWSIYKPGEKFCDGFGFSRITQADLAKLSLFHLAEYVTYCDKVKVDLWDYDFGAYKLVKEMRDWEWLDFAEEVRKQLLIGLDREDYIICGRRVARMNSKGQIDTVREIQDGDLLRLSTEDLIRYFDSCKLLL